MKGVKNLTKIITPLSVNACILATIHQIGVILSLNEAETKAKTVMGSNNDAIHIFKEKFSVKVLSWKPIKLWEKKYMHFYFCLCGALPCYEDLINVQNSEKCQNFTVILWCTQDMHILQILMLRHDTKFSKMHCIFMYFWNFDNMSLTFPNKLICTLCIRTKIKTKKHKYHHA